MKSEGKGKLDILAILGGSKPSEEGEEYSDADLALKSAFKAIKSDDFETFRDSLNEWCNCRDESPVEEPEELEEE